MRLFLALLTLVACGGSESSADSGVPDGGNVDGGEDSGEELPCSLPEAALVRLTTDDGVSLEADHYPAAEGSAAVVLLHMIPPSNTRANFPSSFVEELFCRGITVLNVDRRGAGGSEGVATDAYEGPNGVLDARGAVEWLLDTEQAPDPMRIGVVGASNGTTTLLDYAVLSMMESSIEEPAGLVLLSGGAYTTNQNELDNTALGDADALFVYPAAEAAWNEEVADSAPDDWRFVEVDPGGHGTALLRDEDTLLLIVDFLEDVL